MNKLNGSVCGCVCPCGGFSLLKRTYCGKLTFSVVVLIHLCIGSLPNFRFSRMRRRDSSHMHALQNTSPPQLENYLCVKSKRVMSLGYNSRICCYIKMIDVFH